MRFSTEGAKSAHLNPRKRDSSLVDKIELRMRFSTEGAKSAHLNPRKTSSPISEDTV